MTAFGRGFDLFTTVAASLLFGFAGWVFGSQLFSSTAGGALGLAAFMSTLAMMASGYLEEQRMAKLLAGLCPRCRASVRVEHVHRRWQAERAEWLRPATSWECPSCHYGHSEAWACPACTAGD